MQKLELWYPIKNPMYIAQGFGENLISLYKELGMVGHNGIDMVGYEGQAIYAAHDGVVTFAGDDGSAGLGVVIRTHDRRQYKDGESYFKTIYWHCKRGSILVRPDQYVKVGQKIAECDTTGFATGSHLHFGLKPIAPGEEDWMWSNIEQTNGYFGAIDPAPYWNGYYAVDAPLVMGTLKLLVEALKKLLGLFKKGRAIT